MKNLFQFAGAALLAATMLFSTTSCNQDPCVTKKITCANGGTCLDGICSCADGYEGELCADLSRTKFLTAGGPATYTGAETCTTGTDNYSIVLSPSSDAAKITVTNLYNNSTSPYVVTAPVKGSAFSIASATAGGTANFSNITGTLTGDSLKVTYTITNGTTTNSCTFRGKKN